ISNNTTFIFNDVLFFEGLIVIFMGAFSSISGNSNGLSMNALGQSNAQYVGFSNLEITKKEKELTSNIVKTYISIGISSFTLIFAGGICVLLSIII
ncbi:MAG: hypothetical protein ACRC2K_09695, partial [Clostridium sp.]